MDYTVYAKDVVIERGKDLFTIKRFYAKPGEFISVIGPNGGGKTSFMKAILGLVSYKGELRVFGKPSRALTEKERIRIGYLPQFSFQKALFPITLREVAEMGGPKAEHYLEKLGLKGLEDKLISEVSGGQRQRALIARALASDGDLIILDEPEASLDSRWRDKVMKLLYDEMKKGKTIITVTHDLSIALPFTSRLACINKGLYIHGKPDRVVKNMGKVYGCDLLALLHGKHAHLAKDHWVVKKHD